MRRGGSNPVDTTMGNVYVQADLEGIIDSLTDFKSEALTPVFEAIDNSIRAIQDREKAAGKKIKGEITVRIIRESTVQQDLSKNTDGKKIISFEIVDNGIGFDKKNFKSFETPFTTTDKSNGRKGIGRMFWLKAFDKVEINSVYSEKDRKKQRRFEFSKKYGIVPKDTDLDVNAPQQTEIKLIGFNERYRKKQSAFKRSRTIAERILEYFISYFILETAPSIKVIDSDREISINNLYSEIAKNVVKRDLKIGRTHFNIVHTKLSPDFNKEHKLIFCGHNREVSGLNIETHLGKSPFVDPDHPENEFFYNGYISGKYLDQNVDATRTSFLIPDNEKDNLSGILETITMNKIRESSINSSKEFLYEFITKLDEIKHNNVNNYLSKNPALLNIPEYCPGIYNEIDADSPPEKIHAVLYKHKGIAELEIQKDVEKLLQTQFNSRKEMAEEYDRLLRDIRNFDKYDIVKFLLWRKLIIKLLQNKLKSDSLGEYEKEAVFHDIIFPRYTHSDKILFEDQNLWIFDELLNYHKFAASEPKLSTISDATSDERPDIICCQMDDDAKSKAVSIFEFKKPQRPNFDEDPIKQLKRYILDIKGMKIKTYDGRDFNVDPDSTIFYCYAICDINQKIIDNVTTDGFQLIRGGLGYYRYIDPIRAHMYVVSFDKLMSDVTKRHKIFFEKLGIVEPAE